MPNPQNKTLGNIREQVSRSTQPHPPPTPKGQPPAPKNQRTASVIIKEKENHPLTTSHKTGSYASSHPHQHDGLLRKEVIQPHLPVRLPCYDFVPIASPTFDDSLHKG